MKITYIRVPLFYSEQSKLIRISCVLPEEEEEEVEAVLQSLKAKNVDHQSPGEETRLSVVRTTT